MVKCVEEKRRAAAVHAVWMNGGRPTDALRGRQGRVEPRDLHLARTSWFRVSSMLA